LCVSKLLHLATIAVVSCALTLSAQPVNQSEEKMCVTGALSTKKQERIWYVAANKLALRSEPNTQDYEYKYLSLGDELRGSCPVNGWLKVTDQSGHIGWVSASYIQANKPTVSAIAEQIRQTKNGDSAQRLLLAHRAVLLDPLSVEAAQLLVTALSESPVAKGLAEAQARLNHLTNPSVVLPPHAPGVLLGVDKGYASAFARVVDGRLMPLSPSQTKRAALFKTQYYQAGKTYHFQEFESAAELVMVQKERQGECGTDDIINVQIKRLTDPAKPISFGLASDVPFNTKWIQPRSATVAQSQILLKKARQQLSKYFDSTHIDLLLQNARSGRADNAMTAVYLIKDKSPLLIGTFNANFSDLDRLDIPDTSFRLILSPDEKGEYQVALETYKRALNFDEQHSYVFHSHWLSPTDSKPYLIFTYFGWEWSYYEVIAQDEKTKKWTSHFRGGGGGC
jgi:SH3-like domain-containing protein